MEEEGLSGAEQSQVEEEGLCGAEQGQVADHGAGRQHRRTRSPKIVFRGTPPVLPSIAISTWLRALLHRMALLRLGNMTRAGNMMNNTASQPGEFPSGAPCGRSFR